MENTIYLASPFFNKKEKLIKEMVRQHLIDVGFELHDPQTPSSPSSWENDNPTWGAYTFNKDIESIQNSTYVVAIDWGLYGDCGTAWEIGYAYAIGKPVLVLVPAETLPLPHSLMVANGSINFISISRFLTLDKTDIDSVLTGNTFFFLSGVEQK